MNVDEAQVALLGSGYAGKSDGSMRDIWYHFTTRGHKGRVQCVSASFDATFFLTGGVDYTTRVWKYDARYEAYDLIAVLNHEPPHEVPKESTNVIDQLWDSVFKKKIDWDNMPQMGVMAGEFTSSRVPGESAMRTGPILSGTSHGDLTIFCINSSEEGEGSVVKSFHGLHKGTINDIMVTTTEEYVTEERASGLDFLVCTAGEDGNCIMMHMHCSEAENPDFDTHKSVKRNYYLDVLFFGGGGRHGNNEVKEEENPEEENPSNPYGEEYENMGVARTCLQFSSLDIKYTLEHDSAVHSVRSVGDLRSSNQATIATCTTEGVHLWNHLGEKVMFLKISHGGGKRQHPVNVTDHTRMTTVTKEVSTKNGGVIMTVLMCHGEGQVAVWGLEDGRVGQREDDGALYYSPEGWEQKMETFKNTSKESLKEEASIIDPLCVYRRPGELLDVDQSGDSTTFAVQVKDEITVDLWNLEAVPPGLLVVEPEGPVSLLVCPGKEDSLVQMNHTSKVCDTKVVEDEEGPALISGCEEGTAFVWDLEGDDKGQCYAELRSLAPLEIILPPIMLVVTAAQVLSFAFGPAVPWKKEVHQHAAIAHKVMMLDFKFTIKINKEDIFWPEMTIICGLIFLFQVCAIIGAPQMLDDAVRSAMSSVTHTEEGLSRTLMKQLVKVLKALRAGMYLAVSLLSTILVVPMIQSCAQAVDCIREPGCPWYEMLLGNPHNKIYLAAAPNVMCYKGDHLKLVGVLIFLMPTYILFLIPYAVASGDAHYVPKSTLYDVTIWKKGNTWRAAARRKATAVHLAFLTVNPHEAFRTLAIELLAKIALPVITVWTTSQPLFQMICVATIGWTLWWNSLAHCPYVERKFAVMVQDLKLFTAFTMTVGVFTVCLHDAESNIPVYFLVVGAVAVLSKFIVQMCLLESSRPKILAYTAPRKKTPYDEEQPLLQTSPDPTPAVSRQNEEE